MIAIPFPQHFPWPWIVLFYLWHLVWKQSVSNTYPIPTLMLFYEIIWLILICVKNSWLLVRVWDWVSYCTKLEAQQVETSNAHYPPAYWRPAPWNSCCSSDSQILALRALGCRFIWPLPVTTVSLKCTRPCPAVSYTSSKHWLFTCSLWET